MPNLARKAMTRLQRQGARRALAHLGHLLSERYHDARLGISTRGKIPLRGLGIDDPRCKPYAPTAYRSFHAVMKQVPVHREDAFLDYGSGKGRVVILAAMRPFSRVIGVEISEHLCAIARRNVRKARKRLLCPRVEIVTANAADYALPDEATVVHFFDPFRDEILEAVLAKMRESLRRRPRRITVLFADPAHLEAALANHPWLRKTGRVPYPYAEAREPALRYEYGIYESVTEVGDTAD